MLGKLFGSVLNIAVNATEIVLAPVAVLVQVTDEAVSGVAKNINEFIKEE